MTYSAFLKSSPARAVTGIKENGLSEEPSNRISCLLIQVVSGDPMNQRRRKKRIER